MLSQHSFVLSRTGAGKDSKKKKGKGKDQDDDMKAPGSDEQASSTSSSVVALGHVGDPRVAPYVTLCWTNVETHAQVQVPLLGQVGVSLEHDQVTFVECMFAILAVPYAALVADLHPQCAGGSTAQSARRN